MQYNSLILYICITLVIIWFIIIIVKYFYKKIDRLSRRQSENIVLFIIFILPFLLWVLDLFNLFSLIFPKYFNITREYDWLSFIGTYAGSIVSAILLIFITRNDRNENTRVLQESQRPYLDISYMKIEAEFFDKDLNNVVIFDHGIDNEKKEKKKEYLTLCIKNNGASVAIISINKTEFKVQYNDGKKIKKENNKLNAYIDRISIKSGEEIYIKLTDNKYYNNGRLLKDSKIIESKIYYKDLFNQNYLDECLMQDKLIVIHDNEKIMPNN